MLTWATGPEAPWGRLQVKGIRQSSGADAAERLSIDLVDGGVPVTLEGEGNGPIDASRSCVRALGHIAQSGAVW